jgi:uncharacterized membrane protein
MLRTTQNASSRFDAVDALRGVAMLWMTVYHLSFDLNQFGYIHQNFYHDPVWTGQRTLIVSLFLACAGMGQALAVGAGQSWTRFWRRWLQVLACALLVTAGSWLMYPQSFIYFGVLHGMAVMLLIARLTVGWGRWLWPAGAVLIAIYFLTPSALAMVASRPWVDALNSPALNWLGLITVKPVTEDYVPLLPWMGVIWWGVALGHWLGSGLRAGRLSRRLPAVFQPLVAMGRWSLSYYMVHQPVMIGILMLAGWLLPHMG